MKLRERISRAKIRNAERWATFKEKHPKLATAARGFFPSLYYQIPVLGQFIATRPEVLTYLSIPKERLSDNLWIFLSLGTALVIPIVSLTKKGIRRALGRNGKTMSPGESFVMSDIIGTAPAYFACAWAHREITQEFSTNHMVYPISNVVIGNVASYMGLGLLWYLKYRKYFRRVREEREEGIKANDVTLWRRFVRNFSMGLEQSALFILIENKYSNLKILQTIRELAQEAKDAQKEKTTISEEMVELIGISRGGDIYLVPLNIAIISAILASGIDGYEAFIIFAAISAPIARINSLWKNASTVGLFDTKVLQKEEFNSEQ